MVRFHPLFDASLNTLAVLLSFSTLALVVSVRLCPSPKDLRALSPLHATQGGERTKPQDSKQQTQRMC